MTGEDLDEHDLKKLPENHDSWVQEEPGPPEWEEYMNVNKSIEQVDGEDKLVISIKVLDSAYIASSLAVKLDEYE